ncbi:16946_t:CDS:2, partial [Acaulospora colombiana]
VWCARIPLASMSLHKIPQNCPDTGKEQDSKDCREANELPEAMRTRSLLDDPERFRPVDGTTIQRWRRGSVLSGSNRRWAAVNTSATSQMKFGKIFQNLSKSGRDQVSSATRTALTVASSLGQSECALECLAHARRGAE